LGQMRFCTAAGDEVVAVDEVAGAALAVAAPE
jgi:hypothetical protein